MLPAAACAVSLTVSRALPMYCPTLSAASDALALASRVVDEMAEAMVECSSSSADLGASDSDRAKSSLANLLCTSRMEDCRLGRATVDRVMVVIEREFLEMEVDGRDRARKATWRRENLKEVC